MGPMDIGKAAGQQFLARQSRGRELVRTGRMDPRTATDHLRPWLAIACHCGADLPDLEEGIANLREVNLIWGEAQDVTEAEARARLADEICLRSRWAPVLAKARDDALTGPHATPDQCANALALREIASHLGHDPNGRHHVPLFDLRKAWARKQAGQPQLAGAAA